VVFGGLFCFPYGRKEFVMFKRIWNSAKSVVCAGIVPALIVTAMVLCGVDAFAQTPTPEAPTIDSFVDWTGVFVGLSATIGVVIVAAVGLSLSVWAVRFVLNIVKSMAR
jgi:hypothetical protein